jgi:hypothetical protein
MSMLRLAFLCTLLLSGVLPAYAEIKTLTAEATYIMGDGESPSFAEAMALQRAKQTALEEAGTYVQSYTKSVNQDLTKDEIQTLAGGVMQVEVLEKTRSLVADGLRFYTKIKATVTTEKMEELARRIKGRNVAEEYQKLQAEYGRLNRELEGWKQRAAKTPTGRERDAALDHIREGTKAFERVQQLEGEFFQRLVSGKQLVESASHDKDIIDDLLKTIAERGFVVKVGEIKAVVIDGQKDILAVNVPLTIRVSETLDAAMSNATHALGGIMRSDVEVWFPSSQSLRIGKDTRSEATVTLVRLGRYLETARSFQEGIIKLAFLVTFEGPKVSAKGTLDQALELLELMDQKNELDENAPSSFAPSAGDGSEPYQCYLGYTDDNWFPLRRIFPVAEIYGNKSLDPKFIIDNGWYDRSRVCEVARTKGYSCRFIFKELPAAKTEMQDIPSRDGYVAIVRDEATFVARMNLHADLVKKVTKVSVRVVPRSQLPVFSVPCGIVQ